MTTAPASDPFTLVLGGGGGPGAAFLIGALRALRTNGPVDPTRADHIIGTSAGAFIGSLVATGTPLENLRHVAFPDDPAARSGRVLERAWTTPLELGFRLVGTTWVLNRSLLRLPGLTTPPRLGRLFRGGLNTMRDGERINRAVTSPWPSTPLWLTAVDLDSGRRRVLRRPTHDGPHACPLHRAVMASMAVPGAVDPIRIGDRVLVDGGIHSVTNLDVARFAAPRRVVCLMPMGFDPRRPPALAQRFSRGAWNAQIAYERSVVERTGRRVLLIRPDRDVLALHGINFLRHGPTEEIIAASYETTLQALARSTGRQFFDEMTPPVTIPATDQSPKDSQTS